MKLKKQSILIIALIVIVIGIAIYFLIHNRTKIQQPTNEIKYDTVDMITNLRIGTANYDTMQPLLTNNQDLVYISQLIFEPLLKISSNYQIELALAKEWSKIDSTAYVIKLKENIAWQDGSSFSAEDVQFTINTLQKIDSIYTRNVKDIKSTEIVDQNTIRINLNQEIPFYEYQLIFPIISKKQYEIEDIKKSKAIPIGTGQYKINKIEEDKIELIKNEKWWNYQLENANLKTIYICLYETMGEVYNALKIENIDLFNTNIRNIEDYIGTMGYNKKEYAGREYDYLAINCKNDLLQYVEVRQAIFYVIDKENINANVFEKQVYSSWFPLDYGSSFVDNNQVRMTANLKKAKKILEEAGWKYENQKWKKKIEGVKKVLSFQLLVDTNNQERVKVAEVIEKQLESFGIEVNVAKVSNSKYQTYLENKNYEMVLTGVYNSYSPDLNSFLGKENRSNYENEEIQGILKEINSITQLDLLKEKMKKVIEIYQRDVPFISLYRNKSMVIYNQSFRGEITPNNYSIFYNVTNWYRQ